MKEDYIYPAKLFLEDGMFNVEFLDFPNIMRIKEYTQEEALKSAQECLALEIIECENNTSKKLPAPTEIQEGVIFIHVWMPRYRYKAKEVYVRKNVTIPKWLDILAGNSKINYSATLADAIKRKLGVNFQGTDLSLKEE